MRLLVLGALLEALYAAAFVGPFSLLGHVQEPAQDLGKLTSGTPESALGFLAVVAGLCLISWLAYQSAQGMDPRRGAAIAFAFAIVFAVTLVWMYPIDALDLFDYAMRGRILGVFGDNPYLRSPAQYAWDAFLPPVGWKDYPSVYGPVWLYVEALIARAAGDNQISALLGLKVVAATASLVCAFSIYQLVRRRNPDRAAAAVVLFAWNPLVVLMVGSGHNDAVMMAFVMVGLLLAGSRRPALGLWLLGLSVAVKIALAPVLPALMIGQLAGRDRRSAVRIAIVAGLALAVTLVVVHAPVWPGWTQFGPLVRLQEPLFTLSPLGMLRELALQSNAPDVLAPLVSPLGTLVMGLLALQATWRAHRGPSAAVHAAHDAMFWILFLALAWWQPWYLIWLACFSAIDDRPWTARLSWVVALVGLVSLFDRFYLTERWLPVPWLEHHVHTLVLVYLPPIAVAITALVHNHVRIQRPRVSAAPLRSGVTRARLQAARSWRRVIAAGSVAFLVVCCAASVSDGLLQGMVAYERDTAIFYYPLLTWAADQLHTVHQLPLWSPNLFGGYPILADGELGLASPVVRLALAVLPVDRAFVVLRVFHLCVAAIGCYALARAWRLPHVSAALAGVTFALGSFFASQIHHENVVRSGVWLPGILALVERSLRSTGRTRRGSALGASACVGFAALGLDPQILVIDVAVLIAYALLRTGVSRMSGGHNRWHQRARSIATTVTAVVLLGVGLGAVQLVPFAELVEYAARGRDTYSQAVNYSLTPPGLVQLLFPFFFRGPDNNLQWGLGTPCESYLYVGVAPLVLGLIGLTCVRRREIWIWAVLGALGLLVALGPYSPLNFAYVASLTAGLGGVLAPGRWSLVVVLSVAMLAAYGQAWLQRQARYHDVRQRQRAARVVVALIGVFIALVSVLVLAHDALLGDPRAAQALLETRLLSLPPEAYLPQVNDVLQGLAWSTNLSNSEVWRPLCALLAVGVLIGTWQLAPLHQLRQWRGWPVLLLLMSVADLLSFGWNIHPREPLAALTDPQPSALAVQRLLAGSTGGPYRVMASPVISEVAPDQLARLGLEEASGYSSLGMPRHSEFLRRVRRVDDGLLDAWNIRYLLEPAHYGAVANYGGVDYLPGQALLSAAAGGTLGYQTFRLPVGLQIAQIRAIFTTVKAAHLSDHTPVAELVLGSPAAEADSARVRLTGPGMSFEPTDDAAGGLHLAYSSVDLSPPVRSATLRIRSALPAGQLTFYGIALVGADGSITQLLGHHQTKYREVYRDSQIAVLENSAAYPRAFFVPRARVVPAGWTTLDLMTTQPFTPSVEVALPTDTPADIVEFGVEQPAITASFMQTSSPPDTADQAAIEDYASDRVLVRVSSARDGFVVLSNTFYPGWRAFVDGHEQSLLRGDMLFQVVPVTAGEHLLRLQFQPNSFAIGAVISMLAGVVLIGLACWLLVPEP